MIIEIEQYDAHKCRLHNRRQQQIIWKILSWYDSGIDKQKSILQCIGRTGCYFPIGLLPHVYKQLKILGHTLEYTYLDFPEIKHKLIPKLPGIKFEPYQHKILAKVGPKKRGIAVAPTGCITGDTIININRAKLGRKFTIEHLYKKHNNIKSPGPSWNPNIITFVRSLQENKIKLNEIENIIYSGIKEVYQLTLWNGNKIKATSDHKIMTKKGWIKLINLTNDDYVMCDSLHTKKSKIKKPKIIYEQYTNLWFHPYAIKTKTKKEKKGYTKKIDKHRIIFEAKINKLNVKEFIKILRTDKEKSKTLKFVNPKKFHIHHRDHNHKNNDPDNLFKLTTKKHLTYHSKENNSYNNFNQGMPNYSKVRSIKYIGKEKTYDIVCKAPYHNFVANRIVIHNSGKSVVIGGMVNKLRVPETIIVTPTKTIFNQLVADFHRWFPDKTIGQMGDGKKDMGDITIGLFQTLREINWNKSKAQLVIVDEAHRISNSHIKILSKLRWANYRYGLTATPHDQKNFEKWARMIGCLGPILYEAEEKEVEVRVVPVEVYMIHFHVAKKHSPYQKCLREDVLFNKSRNKKLLSAAKALSLDHGKNCLFLIDEIEQGKRITQIADKMGLHYEFAHGNNPKETNELIKTNLNNGTTKLVIATQVFGLGTNIPNVDCVVMGSVRKSYIDTIQKIGRGRRRVEGKDKLIVIDSIDRVSGRNRFCGYFYGYSLERIKHYKSKKWEVKRLLTSKL